MNAAVLPASTDEQTSTMRTSDVSGDAPAADVPLRPSTCPEDVAANAAETSSASWPT